MALPVAMMGITRNESGRGRSSLPRGDATPMELETDSSGGEDSPPRDDQRRLKTFARCSAHKMPKGTESLSYEVNESEQYLDYVARHKRAKKGRKGSVRWVLLCGIGLFTGLVAITVDFSIELLAEARMQVNDAVARAMAHATWGVFVQYLAFVGMRMAFASVAGILVCFLEVLAAGSGIPEIKCYLNGVRLKHVVGFKALVAKAVGIVFSVAADLPVGKEGPMIHSGAIIGALFTNVNLRRHVRPFSLDTEKRDMVAAGASAGVSAAFGAPMGSVLFAIEEGTSHMNPSIMMRLFVSCSVAALVSRLFSSMENGMRFGQLGTSVPVSFGKFYNMDYDLRELFFFTVLALLGGVAGSLFNAMNKKLTKWRQRHVPSKGVKRFVEVLVVDFLVVTILFWIPVLAVGGKCVEFEGEELSPTLKLFWQTGTASMKKLFHQDEPFHAGYLLVFTLVNFELSCLTYGLGVPSGLFVPSLLTGACYGRLLGQWVHYNFDERTWAHAGVYSLIGAVSNLAGTARITISLAMILMEATGNASFSLPIFYVVMVAKWTGDFLNCVTKKGIYDMHIIELKHVPLLEQTPEKELITIQVREVMARNPVTFEAVETVGNLLETLESCGHNGFPILYPGTRRLVGLLRRSVLHRLLEYALEKDILQEPTGVVRKLPPIRYEDIAFKTAKCETYDQLRVMLEPKYLDHRLDLRPYVNRNGYMMPKHASVASCFSLFRKLGLRHLPVVAPNGDLCGIVTRKDLILCEDEDDRLLASLGVCNGEDTDENSLLNSDDETEDSQRMDSGSDDEEDGDMLPPSRSEPEMLQRRSTRKSARAKTMVKRDSGFFGGGGM